MIHWWGYSYHRLGDVNTALIVAVVVQSVSFVLWVIISIIRLWLYPKYHFSYDKTCVDASSIFMALRPKTTVPVLSLTIGSFTFLTLTGVWINLLRVLMKHSPEDIWSIQWYDYSNTARHHFVISIFYILVMAVQIVCLISEVKRMVLQIRGIYSHDCH
eukprot:UN02602